MYQNARRPVTTSRGQPIRSSLADRALPETALRPDVPCRLVGSRVQMSSPSSSRLRLNTKPGSSGDPTRRRGQDECERPPLRLGPRPVIHTANAPDGPNGPHAEDATTVPPAPSDIVAGPARCSVFETLDAPRVGRTDRRTQLRLGEGRSIFALPARSRRAFPPTTRTDSS